MGASPSHQNKARVCERVCVVSHAQFVQPNRHRTGFHPCIDPNVYTERRAPSVPTSYAGRATTQTAGTAVTALLAVMGGHSRLYRLYDDLLNYS